MIKKLLFLFIVFGAFSFATNFNSCQTFSTPDTYDLTGNIQINASSCLTVSSPNVTIDCHGFEIVGNYTENTYGIAIQHSDNFTLQNCIFRQFGSALTYTNGSHALMRNNTFDNSTASGLLFSSNDLISHNVTFTNNTVSNNWINGIEMYNMSDGNFSNNTFFGHEHGHGTDRTGQFVRNVANTHWSNNYMYNNTICFRNDAVNVSNVYIENNICENVTGTGFLTFSGASSGVGRFGNFTMRNNTVTASPTSIGFDFGWAASTTTQEDCANWLLSDNMATGGAYLMLNSSNSSTAITNLSIGGLLICDADNLQLSNINVQGGGLGRNGIEIMQVNDMSLFNLSANNVYTGIRGLIVNDSVFDTININGGQISSINFAGGTSSRNNLSNIFISNVTANSAIAMGGVGNYVSNFYIFNSSTISWAIGFQASTTAINNTFDGCTIENVPIAIGIRLVGSGNIIKNCYLKNTSTIFFVNATGSNVQITLENISVTNTLETLFTTLDLYDNISVSEQYQISLPESVPSFTNSSYLDVQSYLNRTSFGSVNASTNQLNMSILETPLEFSRLTWWTNNGTDWAEQAVINNGLGKLTLNDAKAYPIGTNYLDAIFYYDMCPIINQSGYIPSYQNYSGAPNLISGLTNACVILNASNIEFDCQNPMSGTNNWITNDGTATAAGIYIPAGLNNVTVRNCNIQQYYYGGYSVSNSNNTWDTNQFYNNSITGLYTDSVNTITVQNNTFLLNQIGFEGAFNVDSAFIYLNQFLNQSVRGISLSSSSDLMTIDSNTFNFNNIALTLQNTNLGIVTNNNISNSTFHATQIYSTTQTSFSNNRLLNNYQGMDGSSNSQLSIQDNNFYMSSGATGISLATENTLSIQRNNVTNSRTCGICASGTTMTFFNNTINDTGQGLGFSAPNLEVGGSNIHVELNNLLNSTLQGISVTTGTNNITVLNNQINDNDEAGILLVGVGNSSITNNNIFRNSRGTYITTSHNVSIQANNYTNNTEVQIWFVNSLFNNTVRFNNVSASGVNGFYFTGATTSGNTISDNNLTNLASAILFEGGENYDIDYNTITSSTQGIRFNGANNNRFSYNNISGNADAILFSVFGGSNINFSNNRIFSNANTGANLGVGSTVRFDNNEIYLNPRGMNIGTLNNTLGQDNHFYANTYDLYIDSASDTRFFNLTSSSFDNTNGSFANYSNISIIDTALSNERYSINYGTDIPINDIINKRFANKHVNITNIENAIITTLIYHYLDSEVTTFEPTDIYKYESNNLIALNSILDTSLNTLTKNNYTEFGLIGLYNISCANLTSSGTYSLYSNLSSITSCLEVQSNDITLDCQGNTISGDNSIGSYGILSNGYNNTLIQNCRIQNFDRDISISTGTNWTINNNSLLHSNTGILMSNHNNTTVSNNYATNMTVSGDSAIYALSSSSNIIINNNQIENVSGRGIYCSSVTNCEIRNNILSNIGRMGIRVASGNIAVVDNNSVINTSDRLYLFDLSQANINITNNFGNISATDGMIFDVAGTSRIVNNVIRNSDTQDYRISSATTTNCSGITFENNTASGGSEYLFNNTVGAIIANRTIGGLILCGTNNSVIDNVTIYNSEKQNNVLDVLISDNVTLTNINSSHGYSGIVAFNSSGNVFDADLRNANGAIITGTGYGFWANAGNWNVSNIQTSDSRTIGLRGSNSAVVSANNLTSSNDTIGTQISTAAGILSLYNSSLTKSPNAIKIIGGTLNLSTIHLYNNSIDFLVNASGPNVYAEKIIFDQPSGNYDNYMNVSFNDTNAAPTVIYSLNWSSIPATLPSGNLSFRNKYLSFNSISGSPIIENMLLSWETSELNSSINESDLSILLYNNSWNVISSTPNVTNNNFDLSNVSLSGVYSITYAGTTPEPQQTQTPIFNGGNNIYIVNPDGTITQYPFQPLVNATANIMPNITIPQINISVPNISLPNITVRIPQIQPPTDQPSILKYICGGVALLSLIMLPLALKFMKKLFIYAAILVGLILVISAILLYTGVI